MKKLFAAAILAVASSVALAQAPGGAKADRLWVDDIESAFKEAARSKKMLFINFTGSDWCYWCKIADKNIFAKPEWREFSKKFVCLKVDFPRADAPSREVMAKRRELMGRFGVRGFPTFVLSDSNRSELARFSAGRKSAGEFVSEVEKALKTLEPASSGK